MDMKYINSFFVKIFIFLTFLFARTFMGLSFYGIRLGEILIGSSALVLLIYTSIIPLVTKKYFLNNKKN